MDDRFRNERRRGEWQSSDERSGWGRGRQEEGRDWHAEAREPAYSSDYDETYGSEWTRDRGQRESSGQGGNREHGGGQGQHAGGYGQHGGSYGQHGGGSSYNRGSAGMYGGGSGGGYVGGRGGSGYGGSTGTDYGRGNYGGYAGNQGRFGGDQGGYAGTGGGNFGAGNPTGAAGRARSDWTSSQSPARGGFAGRGPKGYTRTDDRIREDVCDRLSLDDDVDASEIEVQVQNGEVTLSGTVQTRSMKHQAEDLAEDVAGVRDVHNQLRVMKGMLNELKDKLTGSEKEQHFANTGTKDKPANGMIAGKNGAL